MYVGQMEKRSRSLKGQDSDVSQCSQGFPRMLRDEEGGNDPAEAGPSRSHDASPKCVFLSPLPMLSASSLLSALPLLSGTAICPLALCPALLSAPAFASDICL